MSHSFRDDPRFLITLLPALEVSRMQALKNAQELEEEIESIKELLGRPSGGRDLPQPPQPPLQIANGYQPPPPPSRETPPSERSSSIPTPDTQAGFILAEARRRGGRINLQEVSLAAGRSNNPMIRKMGHDRLARSSAMNNIVSRGFAVRGPERGTVILTPKGLGPKGLGTPEERDAAPSMPGNLRRALAKVASDGTATATAATRKSTRVYPKGLPPKPDTQYGFILAEARRQGGMLKSSQLIAAASRAKNPIIRKVGTMQTYSVARSSLVKKGFLERIPGPHGEAPVKLTPSGMEATNYVATWGTQPPVTKEPAGSAAKTAPTAKSPRASGLSQAAYIAQLALENGGTISNDQIREAAGRGPYPKLAHPDNLSVAVTKAIHDGYAKRIGPGLLEVTTREKHKHEKQQQQQFSPVGHEAAGG